jgi:hypothetical protein
MVVLKDWHMKHFAWNDTTDKDVFVHSFRSGLWSVSASCGVFSDCK